MGRGLEEDYTDSMLEARSIGKPCGIFLSNACMRNIFPLIQLVNGLANSGNEVDALLHIIPGSEFSEEDFQQSDLTWPL